VSTEPVGVTIEDLHLSFGSTQVLKGVNLEIEPGEFFAFLGPSGSGKSTLLRAIAGFGPLPSGRILIDGEDVAALPPWRRNVGMVFQNYALWPHMSVRRNVAFGLEERKTPGTEIRERVDAALELVGLIDLADRRPSQLSGGQQQRVALARTVVVEPRVLLLDEPLSNLDANLRVQMRRDILNLQRQLRLTTIFVTHDQEEANTMSDRMAVLNEGVIQQIGAPMALYDHPANLFVADFLGTANVLRGRFSRPAAGPRFVSEDGIELPLAEPPAANADAGVVVLRPQSINVLARSKPGETRDVVLDGMVRYREFLGAVIRYGVDVGEHLLLVDHGHRPGERVFEPGAEVAVHVDPSHIVSLTE
jgi:iron(III) transport system ATP-binding protein